MGVMTNKDRIQALIGNVKNWSWDVYPQFRVEREDAVALQDLQALKEYIKEKENGRDKSIHNRQDEEGTEEQDNRDIKTP